MTTRKQVEKTIQFNNIYNKYQYYNYTIDNELHIYNMGVDHYLHTVEFKDSPSSVYIYTIKVIKYSILLKLDLLISLLVNDKDLKREVSYAINNVNHTDDNKIDKPAIKYNDRAGEIIIPSETPINISYLLNNIILHSEFLCLDESMNISLGNYYMYKLYNNNIDGYYFNNYGSIYIYRYIYAPDRINEYDDEKYKIKSKHQCIKDLKNKLYYLFNNKDYNFTTKENTYNLGKFPKLYRYIKNFSDADNEYPRYFFDVNELKYQNKE